MPWLSLSHSTPQNTSPAFRLRLRQHSLIYINQSVKTCTAGICLWWKAIESCAGVLKSAEPIPEMFWHSWYLQKTYLRRGYNQPLVYESCSRISEDEWTLPQVLPPTRAERGIVTVPSEPLNPKKGLVGIACYIICKTRGGGAAETTFRRPEIGPNRRARIVKARLNRLGKDQGMRVMTFDHRMRKCNDSGWAKRSRLFMRCMSAHAWGREAHAPVYH